MPVRLERRPFGSQVARRVFLSFILVSLVPVGLLSYLTISRVGRSLEERAYDGLSVAARATGQQILDRLLIAEDALNLMADGVTLDAPTGVSGARLVDAAGSRQLFGPPFDWEVETEPAAASRPLLVSRDEAAGGGLFLAVATDRGRLVGRVDPGYLWDISELLPYSLDVCVIALYSRRLLYCSADSWPEVAPSALTRLASQTSGSFLWEEEGGARLAAYWQLFLASRFDSEPWAIVMSQSAGVARGALSSFNQAFVYTVLVSLIITALLAAAQIRRMLGPLQRLVAGTKRIAERQFDAPIDVGTSDEFGELGRAMNRMAARLGRQFDMLDAFAEIDRYILSSSSLEHGLERVLERAAAVMPGADLGILVVDRDQPDRGQVHTVDRPDSDGPARTELSAELSTWLLENREGALATAGPALELAARLPGADLEAAPVFIAPLLVGDRLRGALLVRSESSAEPVAEDREAIRELAARIAVAVSAADRERELFERAHFDALTGLPNRELCGDRLRQAVAQARREGHQLAVLFIDLDRFKHVNDSLGHTIGDELLKEAALRLKTCLRDTDTAARLGGDEYVVILPHIHGPLEVEAIGAKLINRLGLPFELQGQTTFVSASVGAAIFPDDAKSAEELLRCADAAMYSAKANGRGRCVFFTEELDRRVRERLAILGDLRQALEKREFELVYQPQIDLQTGQPVCVEAMLRWNHPQRGQVMPGIFVPILEDSEFMHAVGRWVIEQALSDYRTWRQRGLVVPRVAVNLAGRQLLDRELPQFVLEQLRRNQIDGAALELELTEHSLVTDFVHANRFFREMRGLGVRVAIDDFGTGYSSLGYLQELHFDCLKIDRVFINGLPEPRSQAIVEAVLTVAHSLGREVVAEGIETEEQQVRLIELGCDLGQGFLYSRPISADDCHAWLARYDDSTIRQRLHAWSA